MIDGSRPDGSLDIDETTLAVYGALLRARTTDAAGLSRDLGVDEATAKEALGRLVRVGLARRGVDGAPSYRAQVPDALLDDLVEERFEALEAAAASLRSVRATAARVRSLYHGVSDSRNALEFERLDGADAIATRIAELSARTGTTLESVMTVVPPTALINGARDSEDRLTRRGVRLRSLHRAAARRSPALAGYGVWLAERGGQIRTTPWPLPTQYMLFDRRAAVVSFEEPDLDGPAAVVLTTREVITCLGTLFDLLWESALPLPDTATDAPTAQPSAGELEILRLMHAGLKDEAIARELGVSTKTVRRALSSLAERLGVKDRFSLGVLAGSQGWLRDNHAGEHADEHRGGRSPRPSDVERV